MNALPKKPPGARRERLVARVKASLPRLTPAELRELGKALVAALEEAEASPAPAKSPRREVLAADRRRTVIYRQELVRCGKEGCKCTEGELHGPYWYAYYRSPRTRRLVKKYVGKEKKEVRVR